MNLLPLLDAFPKKIRVTFVHAVTGDLIGVDKLEHRHLPTAFNRPTSIKVKGKTWRVMKAEPILAEEFTLENKLTLHIQDPLSLDADALGADIPSICGDWPETSAEPSLFSDFSLEISKNQWRQLELLPAMLLPFIREEMSFVESVLFPGNDVNTLEGYRKMHVRKNIRQESVGIPVDEFCERMNILKKGSLIFSGGGFIQNGFAFSSNNYTYYGIANNKMIEELCLETFESVDDEFYQVASTYDFVLVDWCNGKIIVT